MNNLNINNTFNFLLWEDSIKLPFPQEVRPLLSDIKWDTFYWQCAGLPKNDITYTLTGWRHLYQETDETGKTVIQKQDDFNGDIYFHGYFVNPDKEEGNNYLVTFKATFFKGDLMEVVLFELQKQSTKNYYEKVDIINQDFARRLSWTTKWWYKYLYKWYSIVIRSIAYALVYLCLKLKEVITKIALKITPL